MSSLKTWRNSLGLTQAQLAERLGENHKTYSSYERGASPLPSPTVTQLRALGYSGPVDQRIVSDEGPVSRQDLRTELAALKAFLKPRLKESIAPRRRPEIRPAHVRDAWRILSDALSRSGVKPCALPPRATGEWLAEAAEALAARSPIRDRKCDDLLRQASRRSRP